MANTPAKPTLIEGDATPVTETPKVEAPDPFDLDRLRVPADYEADAAVKKLITTVPVRRPHRQEWIWVHPGEEYRGVFMSIELKEEREMYVALPHVAQELPGEIQRRMIYTAQNSSRVTFLWPVRVAAPGDRLDDWSISAHEAAAKAMTSGYGLSVIGASVPTKQSSPRIRRQGLSPSGRPLPSKS